MAATSSALLRHERPMLACFAVTLVIGLVAGCTTKEEPAPSASKAPKEEPKDPTMLHLPPGYDGAPVIDSEHTIDLSGQEGTKPLVQGAPGGRCPEEMVLVLGAYCIDRYEVSLVDSLVYRPLSPHYPPTRQYSIQLFERFKREAPKSRMALGRSLSVPTPPAYQLDEDFEPLARSEPQVLPAGYLSRTTSELACKNAQKRLCTQGEWVRACRGDQDLQFPYGNDYKDGVCNVHRESHPARLIHGNASKNHLDPRLGLTSDDAGPLLRQTGQTSACASQWGQDAIYDMVGNVDEWIDDAGGVFVGGFYSRGTKLGCDASIDTHSPSYMDYSLGTRCCKDAL